MAADGVANTVIAGRLGVSRSTVLGWRSQFVEDGVEGVGRVRPGRGRKPTIPQAKIEQVVHDTQHTTPPDGTHWSVRSMAKHAGISKTKVQQIWSARRLKPHLVETFKLSNDVHFEDKLVDVVALSMTHDYKRNGTTTLFAALNVLTGVILGKCLPRHRNGEFLTFLRLIDRSVDKGL